MRLNVSLTSKYYLKAHPITKEITLILKLMQDENKVTTFMLQLITPFIMLFLPAMNFKDKRLLLLQLLLDTYP